MASPREIDILRRARSSPFGQNILRSIRYAEGTDLNKDPYRVMFGGGTFNDLSRHPDTVVSTDKHKSAAAGAYQFLPTTWNRVASALNLKDFGPEAQDLGALKLIRDRLLPIGGLATLEKEGLSSRVSGRLAPEWASFPTEKGVSFYGQPVKKLADIQKIYGQQSATPVTVSQPKDQDTGTPQRKTTDENELLKAMLFDQMLKRSRASEGPLQALYKGLSGLSQPSNLFQDLLNQFKPPLGLLR